MTRVPLWDERPDADLQQFLADVFGAERLTRRGGMVAERRVLTGVTFHGAGEGSVGGHDPSPAGVGTASRPGLAARTGAGPTPNTTLRRLLTGRWP